MWVLFVLSDYLCVTNWDEQHCHEKIWHVYCFYHLFTRSLPLWCKTNNSCRLSIKSEWLKQFFSKITMKTLRPNKFAVILLLRLLSTDWVCLTITRRDYWIRTCNRTELLPAVPFSEGAKQCILLTILYFCGVIFGISEQYWIIPANNKRIFLKLFFFSFFFFTFKHAHHSLQHLSPHRLICVTVRRSELTVKYGISNIHYK